MEDETLRSRLAQLTRKSRQALRWYTEGERNNRGEGSTYLKLQAAEWRDILDTLVRELNGILENPNPRALGSAVIALRDRFYAEWRRVEAALRAKQQQLVESAQSGDFVRAAGLARDLVSLKARDQAAQAAYHQVQDLAKKGRVVASVNGEQPAPEKPEAPDAAPATPRGKVLPFREQIP